MLGKEKSREVVKIGAWEGMKVFADRSDSAFIEISLLEQLDSEYEKILGMLNSVEMKADKFCFLKPK